MDQNEVHSGPIDRNGRPAQPKLDLLKRVFVPRETRTKDGTLVFRTSDKEVYVRLSDGSIRRSRPKARGKAARQAEKKARLKAKHAHD